VAQRLGIAIRVLANVIVRQLKASAKAPDDPHDQTVKELLDAATRAELERWFGLPSFQQVEEAGPSEPQEDPDLVAVRERRQKALDAVDPAMVERHRRRVEAPEDLFKFKAVIELRIDPSVALLDHAMIDRQASIADPREREIPEQLVDDLRDCTPQALLRDLHRPELDFEKTFEVIDHAAENRVDIVGIVRELMTTRFKLVTQTTTTFREGLALLHDLRTARRQSWTDSLPSLPNRRVTG
jgi:hypothetical protein